MIGIVIACCGKLAAELLAALEHVVGPQLQVEAITIDAADDPAERRAELLECLHRCDTDDGVAVVTDVPDGPAWTLALSLDGEARIAVVAGVNLPLLVKLASVRARPLDEAVGLAQDAARKYITVASLLLPAEARDAAAAPGDGTARPA